MTTQIYKLKSYVPTNNETMTHGEMIEIWNLEWSKQMCEASVQQYSNS